MKMMHFTLSLAMVLVASAAHSQDFGGGDRNEDAVLLSAGDKT